MCGSFARTAPISRPEPGEIRVWGWNVMRGYFDKPKETADARSPDGRLSTGDLGRLGPDKRLEFLGRLKDVEFSTCPLFPASDTPCT